jgi:preprotein translocase subunit SecD
LPKREELTEVWHPKVIEWWRAVWKSPMAGEYLGADMKGGLYLLAELMQRRWTEKDTASLVRIASEIRQQEIRFGLSPIDRRRLQWEVEKAEEAEERTQKRRKSKRLDRIATKDPRDVLKVVGK